MAPTGSQEQIELKEFYLNTNLSEIFEDIDGVKKYFNCEGVDNVIGIFTLTNILNEIAKTREGCNILKALKAALGNPPDNKQIIFNVCDQLTEINKALNGQEACILALGSEDKSILEKAGIKGDLSVKDLEDIIKTNVLGTSETAQSLKQVFIDVKNGYSFLSDLAIQDGTLKVNINKDFFSEKRYIFDGNEITTHELSANKKSEAYIIAHELTHVVSFLNSGVTETNAWEDRKSEKKEKDAGWVDFFNETERMQEIYHGLLLDGFTPKQIIDTFRIFLLIQRRRVTF